MADGCAEPAPPQPEKRPLQPDDIRRQQIANLAVDRADLDLALVLARQQIAAAEKERDEQKARADKLDGEAKALRKRLASIDPHAQPGASEASAAPEAEIIPFEQRGPDAAD